MDTFRLIGIQRMSSTTVRVLAAQITTAVHSPCPDPRDLLPNPSNSLENFHKTNEATTDHSDDHDDNLAMNICAISMLIYAIIADQFVIFL